MNKKDYGCRKKEIFECLHGVPRRILQLHGTENIAEFLVHHFSRPECFNLSHAAYFIDNPDFDYFKGIAGVHSKERSSIVNHWEDPNLFSHHMSSSMFNQKVRSIEKQSLKLHDHDEAMVVSELAKELNVNNPFYKTLPMKYNNYGIFLFEPIDKQEYENIDEHMQESLYLLGFSPVF